MTATNKTTVTIQYKGAPLTLYLEQVDGPTYVEPWLIGRLLQGWPHDLVKGSKFEVGPTLLRPCDDADDSLVSATFLVTDDHGSIRSEGAWWVKAFEKKEPTTESPLQQAWAERYNEGVVYGRVEEKKRRVYYQDIVYAVCARLDQIDGRQVTNGEGIVCGTVETPSTEVQQRMERLVKELQEAKKDSYQLGWREALAGKEEFRLPDDDPTKNKVYAAVAFEMEMCAREAEGTMINSVVDYSGDNLKMFNRGVRTAAQRIRDNRVDKFAVKWDGIDWKAKHESLVRSGPAKWVEHGWVTPEDAAKLREQLREAVLKADKWQAACEHTDKAMQEAAIKWEQLASDFGKECAKARKEGHREGYETATKDALGDSGCQVAMLSEKKRADGLEKMLKAVRDERDAIIGQQREEQYDEGVRYGTHIGTYEGFNRGRKQGYDNGYNDGLIVGKAEAVPTSNVTQLSLDWKEHSEALQQRITELLAVKRVDDSKDAETEKYRQECLKTRKELNLWIIKHDAAVRNRDLRVDDLVKQRDEWRDKHESLAQSIIDDNPTDELLGKKELDAAVKEARAEGIEEGISRCDDLAEQYNRLLDENVTEAIKRERESIYALLETCSEEGSANEAAGLRRALNRIKSTRK
jgi:hypothetical protein